MLFTLPVFGVDIPKSASYTALEIGLTVPVLRR
jgi:hypothetical protein